MVRFFTALLGAVAVIGCYCAATQAQEKVALRWKFSPGEKVIYDMQQEMGIKIKIGERVVETTLKQELETLTATHTVDEQGVASIDQSIRRIRMKMNKPDGGVLDFDSAKPPQEDAAEEDEVAKELAPLMKSLAKAKFGLKMAPTGKVLDVTVPDDLFKEAGESVAGQMVKQMLSKENLKHMSTQGSPVFPDQPLTVGHKWQNRYTMKMPGVGDQTIDTTYTYQGSEQIEGRELHKIGVKMHFEIAAAEDTPVKIEFKEQETDGTIYFDNKAGRLNHSNIKQRIVMEVPLGADRKMTQQITSEMSVKVSPAME